jgi:hypothetical protein
MKLLNMQFSPAPLLPDSDAQVSSPEPYIRTTSA